MWISTPLGPSRQDNRPCPLPHAATSKVYVGKNLDDAAFAKFEHLQARSRPHQKSSVTSRGMTTTISYHAERENVFMNRYTRPYCGLAGQVIDQKSTMDQGRARRSS